MQGCLQYIILLILLWRLWSGHVTAEPAAPAESNDFNSPFAQEIKLYAKAAEIHNLMNESVDPCENFYDFACGHWNRINPANSLEQISTGFFETVQKALNRKIGDVLKEGDSSSSSDNEIDRKVKLFYESCLNLKTLKNVYKDKLIAIIHEFGKMPALEGDRWKAEDFDWLRTVGEIFYKYGISIIIGYDIMVDFADNSVNRLYIGYRNMPLESRSMYLDESNAVYREGYKHKIATNLETFLGLTTELAQETANEIVEFEIGLAQGMIDEKAGLQVADLTRLTTVQEMSDRYAPRGLDFNRFINISLGYVPTAKVYEIAEDYQKNLIDLLNSSQPKVIANYIFYNLVDQFMMKMSRSQEELKGKCISGTKKYFAKNLDNMIYRSYTNSNDTLKGMDFMWHEIQTTFKNLLLSDRLNWISEVTRKYALEKLMAMRLEINSYEKINFTQEFHQLLVSKEDFVENLKAVRILNARNNRNKLNEPPASLEAGEVLSFTPANIIVENTIKVPVSLLQPYYVWSTSYPNAVKYGTLGSLISHELIHGFDDTGRNFDKVGNNRNWWDEVSTKEFKNRTKCFVNQYKNYTYNDRKLPEMVSQSENIADNGGVRLAYEAYLRWYEDAFRSGANMKAESLPRLKYSGKQLFFISYAQLWCSDVHPIVRNIQTSTDSHVPGKFRVIGPLSNFEEFSKEFHCPQGSTMNPRYKCSVY